MTKPIKYTVSDGKLVLTLEVCEEGGFTVTSPFVPGLVTEADWKTWKPSTFKPDLDNALEAFGPKRLLYGSDWPVCLLAVTYKHWVEIVEKFALSLSSYEQKRLWAETAVEAYNLH